MNGQNVSSTQANIIYLDRGQKKKMFDNQENENAVSSNNLSMETNNRQAMNNQAPSNPGLVTPIIKVQFGKDIIFTWPADFFKGNEPFHWLCRDENNPKMNEGSDYASPLNQSSPRSNANSDQTYLPSNQTSKPSQQIQEANNFPEEFLYTEHQVGLLKKQLQFKYKGLLSKSTDTDLTLGVPVVFRFKCKNHWNNACPFLHILQYCRQENGQIYYRHRAVSSDHTPSCTLDDENIQYNVIMRKIDSSMQVLEQIIRKDPQIKPKQILQLFAQQTGEADENFLYEDLHTKNIRRSIKKYFDNAVAKVKGRVRQE